MPLSGPSWVSQFPGSHSVDDLVDPFRTNVQNFLAAMQAGGAEIVISATFRPPQRAYLMHFCSLIAKGQADPANIPAYTGPDPAPDIQWLYTDADGNPDPEASTAAAAAMAAAYDIAFPPVLVSRHTQGLAIDMTISWQGNLDITDGNGLATTISILPRSGANTDLQGIGETYGVIKLLTDPPHWSSDGH